MIQTATERAARKQLECTQAMSVVTKLAGSGSIIEKKYYTVIQLSFKNFECLRYSNVN